MNLRKRKCEKPKKSNKIIPNPVYFDQLEPSYMLKIGIIKEGKIPPDQRVPLTPDQCAHIQENYPVEVLVQSSPHRCFSDDQYRELGLRVVDDVSECQVLIGIKEVLIEELMPNHKYLFFSHTIKKQLYNRPLLLALLEKHIWMVDFEALVDQHGKRVIAFGHFAGIVGAHNALWTYGKRSGTYSIKRLSEYESYAEALNAYRALSIPAVKIVLTGGGRVGRGAAQLLVDAGVQRVDPQVYLSGKFSYPVFTQIQPQHYVRRKEDQGFNKQEFYSHPDRYGMDFQAYSAASDIMINGIFWDKRSPAFFTIEEMRNPNFKIEVIADITCDIAPESSIPSTIRPSTIVDPVYGFDPQSEMETPPFQPNSIDVMAIDNLPSEIPRAASESFGDQLIKYILPELITPQSDLINRATVTKDGKLGERFGYLEAFAFRSS